MQRRSLLQVHALPDAPDRPVPALLAVRYLGEGEFGEEVRVVAGVDHPDDQLVAAGPKDVTHVELERAGIRPRARPTSWPLSQTVVE